MTSWFNVRGTAGGELLILALGNAVGAVVSIVLLRLLTEHMSSDAYGRLALMLTFGVFVNQVYMAGLSNAAGRLFASAKMQGESSALFRVIMVAYARHCGQIIVVGVLFGWICVAIAEIGTISTAVAAVLISIIGGLNSVIIGILNAARWRSSVAALNSADSLIRFALISCWVHQGISIELSNVLWIQAGSASACMMVALYRWRILSRQIEAVQDARKFATKQAEWNARLTNYGRPLTVLGVITFIHQISDRWALNVYLGAEDVGQFAALYQLGVLPFSLLSALALNLFAPILFDAAESLDTGVRDRSLTLNLIAGAGMVIVTLSAFCISLEYSESICSLILGESFRAIAPLLPWGILTAGLFETGQLLALRLQTRMATSQWMLIKGSISFLGIGMNFYGAAYAGLRGLIWAMLTFSMLYLVSISTWILLDAKRQREAVGGV